VATSPLTASSSLGAVFALCILAAGLCSDGPVLSALLLGHPSPGRVRLAASFQVRLAVRREARRTLLHAVNGELAPSSQEPQQLASPSKGRPGDEAALKRGVAMAPRPGSRSQTDRQQLRQLCNNLVRASEQGQVDAAKALYSKARCSLDSSVLRVLATSGSYAEARDWYEKMREEGVAADDQSMEALLEAAVRSGTETSTAEDQDKVSSQAAAALSDHNHTVPWWLLADESEVRERMPDRGVEPDSITYFALMRAYAGGDLQYNRHKKSSSLRQALWDMKKATIEPNQITKGAVLDILAKHDRKSIVQWIAASDAGLPDANVSHYNTALHSLAKDARRKPHNRQRVLELLEEMRIRSQQPTVESYSSVVTTLAAAGDVDGAIKQLASMKDFGLTPTAVHCDPVMKAFAVQGNTEDAERWLAEMRSRGIPPTTRTYNNLINGFARMGEAEEACRVLSEMQQTSVRPDIVTLNCLVRAHARAGNCSGAFYWLDTAPEMGLKPTFVTYNSIASEIAREVTEKTDGRATAAEIDMTAKLLQHMAASGVRPNAPTASSFRRVLGEKCYGSLSKTLGIAEVL